jgi:hypothetical protein
MHEGGSVTERHVTYKGHDIRIMTTYRIEVDGEEVTGHILVNNRGSVHYHAIPNEEFASAVDLVKRIIDVADATDATEASAEHHHHPGD